MQNVAPDSSPAIFSVLTHPLSRYLRPGWSGIRWLARQYWLGSLLTYLSAAEPFRPPLGSRLKTRRLPFQPAGSGGSCAGCSKDGFATRLPWDLPAAETAAKSDTSRFTNGGRPAAFCTKNRLSP